MNNELPEDAGHEAHVSETAVHEVLAHEEAAQPKLTTTHASGVEVDAQGGFSLPPSSNPDLKWYVVHAYSGMEKAVERNIAERILRSGMEHNNKVTGFVGGAKNRPAPISQDEVQKIVSQMQEGSDKPRHKVEFMVGELVRVKEGPFTDFNGSVEEVNYEKNKVRVSVTIFGRATPVELEFSQVEKT